MKIVNIKDASENDREVYHEKCLALRAELETLFRKHGIIAFPGPENKYHYEPFYEEHMKEVKDNFTISYLYGVLTD